MATIVSFNGASYSVPSYGDSGWARGQGNLSSYLVAIASGALQTTGGTFTLSAPVNFGSTYGIISKYFQTESSSPATSGVIRLASGDSISWGTSNNVLTNSGNNLFINGFEIASTYNFTGYLTPNREIYIAGTPLNNYTGSLTVINMVGSYTQNAASLNVFVNGLAQDPTYDYAETSVSSITFNSPLNTGDRISLRWLNF